MHEFNLIPDSYLQRRARARIVRHFGTWAGSTLVTFAVLYGALVTLSASLATEVEQLQRQQAITTQQREQMVALEEEQRRLQKDWRLLRSLRSGMPAETMLLSVESALEPEGMWFTAWHFRRAGIVTAEDPQPRPPSYFVMQQPTTPAAQWESYTHMTINGQAQDYQALSNLASELLTLSHVHDVRVQRTALGQGSFEGKRLVDFELAIIVKSLVGA